MSARPAAMHIWVPFSGLAPGNIGLWQVNVQIPMATAPRSKEVRPIALQLNGVASTDPTTGFRTFIYVNDTPTALASQTGPNPKPK